MRKYQKPVCDCGEELIFYSERIIGEYFKINKDGSVAKRKLPISEYRGGGTGCQNLNCPKCNACYDWDMVKQNNKALLIRGDIV